MRQAAGWRIAELVLGSMGRSRDSAPRGIACETLGHPVAFPRLVSVAAEFARQGEVDLLDQQRPVLDVGSKSRFQIFHTLSNHRFRRAGTGGDQHRFPVLEPLTSNVLGAVDQVCRHTTFLSQFAQSLAIRTVLAAHDQHDVGLAGEFPHGLLPILGGVADVVAGGADQLRKPLPQSVDDTIRVVDAQGGLGEVRDFHIGGQVERIDFVSGFDESNRLRALLPSCRSLRRVPRVRSAR